MNSSDPRLELLLQRLRQRPDLLEPGLSFRPDPTVLGEGIEATLTGSDPLGRPVLLFVEETFPASFLDRVLEAVACLREEPGRFSSLWPRPGDPRVLVLAPVLPDAVLQRFRILGEAIPLRAWSYPSPFRFDPEEGRENPFRLEHPQGRPAAQEILSELSGSAALFGGRLLRTVKSLQPPLEVQGRGWPLILAGREGPFAALHLDGKTLVFASRRETLPLTSEDSSDKVLGLLLAEQWEAVSA